jgi:hypothetical protein
VKIVDVNLLLYAVNEDAPLHGKAKAWFEGVLSGSETVGFEWTALLAFLRLSTRPTVFPKPLRIGEAFSLVESWLAQPCAAVIGPGLRHLALLKGLVEPFGASGGLIADAHLAAVAVEHGAELCSCDVDFSRFPGVRWTHPLT